jgi:signal transduction histidine kinase
VDFTALLKKSAEAFRITLQDKNHLRVDIATDLPDVFVEKDGFKQVVTNLLTNAAKHSQGDITLTARVKEKYITVKVSDNGEGIPPELLPKVFRRGISGKGGTGYGLYICKTIVEAHGGTIEIESETDGGRLPGKGTTVTFTVPVYGGQEGGHNI